MAIKKLPRNDLVLNNTIRKEVMQIRYSHDSESTLIMSYILWRLFFTKGHWIILTYASSLEQPLMNPRVSHWSVSTAQKAVSMMCCKMKTSLWTGASDSHLPLILPGQWPTCTLKEFSTEGSPPPTVPLMTDGPWRSVVSVAHTHYALAMDNYSLKG